MTLDEIKDTLGAQWQSFRACYDSVLQSAVPLLNSVNRYQSEHGGKHLRPLLVLLAANATHSPRTHTASLATAVELMHNASLMHDDVVDNDNLRRGAASIHSKWNVRVALLTGDYYLARMMQLLMEVGDKQVTQAAIATAAAMAEGELLQQQLLLSPPATPLMDDYLQIIRLKTARLIQTSCVLGTCSGDANDRNIMERFGEAYGMAFQIHDDLDDYGHEQLPWMPSATVLKQLLKQYCDQAHEALSELQPSVYQSALNQLVQNITV